MMLDQQAALSRDPQRTPADAPVTVETRFGAFDFSPEQTLYMPRGPHGFVEHHVFGLANLPPPAPETFKLLQALDDPELSFIVVPLDPASGAVAAEDLADGAQTLGMAAQDAIFLLIVTLRAEEGGTTATVNLRAPLVVDLERRLAAQVVLANSAYPIRQPL